MSNKPWPGLSYFDTAVKDFVNLDKVEHELISVCDYLAEPNLEHGKRAITENLRTRVAALGAVLAHVSIPASVGVDFHQRLLSSKDLIEDFVSWCVDEPTFGSSLVHLVKSVFQAIPQQASDPLRRQTIEAALDTRDSVAANERDTLLPRLWELISAVLTSEDDQVSKSILTSAFRDLANCTSDNKRSCDAILYSVLPRLAGRIEGPSLDDVLGQEAERTFGSESSVWVCRGLASLIEGVSAKARWSLWNCRALRNLVRDGLVSELKECRKLAEFMLSVLAPEAWNEFSGFIVALAESQLHIVTPTVVKVRRYVECGSAVEFATETAKDFAWLLVLLERLWLHENAWVVSQGVFTTCAIPKLPLEWDTRSNLEFLQRTFLAAVKDARIYYVSDGGGFTQLSKSMERFFTMWIGKQGDIYGNLERARRLVLSKNLGPAPLLLVSWALGSVCEDLKRAGCEMLGLVSSSLISLDETISFVCKALPERTSGYPTEIRAAILRVWIEKILSFCPGVTTHVASHLIVRCLTKWDKNVCTMRPRRVEVMLPAVTNNKLKDDVEAELGRMLSNLLDRWTNGDRTLDGQEAEVLALMMHVVIESRKRFKFLEHFEKLFELDQLLTCQLMEAVDLDHLLKVVSQDPPSEVLALLTKAKNYRFRLFIEGQGSTSFPLWRDLRLRQGGLEATKALLESLLTPDQKLDWKLHFIAAMQGVQFRWERIEKNEEEALDDADVLHYINHVSFMSNVHSLPDHDFLFNILNKVVKLIPVGDFESIHFALESVVSYLDSDSLSGDGRKMVTIGAFEELAVLWDGVLTMRGHAYFWTLVETTMRIFFHPFTLEVSLEAPGLSDLMKKVWGSCLRGSDDVTQFMPLVSACVLKQIKETDSIPYPELLFAIKLFISLALFGPARRRDQKLLDQLTFSVSQEDWMTKGFKLVECVPSDAFVRLRALEMLGRMDPTNLRDVGFAKSTAWQLMTERWEQTLKGENDTPLRIFVGSRQHKEQAKILQTLLCLSAFMGEDEEDEQAVKEGVDFAKGLLIEGGLHSCILYFVEWLAVELVRKQPQLLPGFASALLDGGRNRGGPAASLLRIIVLCVRAERGIFAGKPEASKVLVLRVFVLCMSHNFATRAHAQWAAAELLEISKTGAAFSPREMALLKLAADAAKDCSGLDEAVKKHSNSESLMQHFNPALHFSVETIFLDFPRIIGLPEEEWLPRDWLRNALGETSTRLQNFLPLKAKSDSLVKFEPKPSQPDVPAMVFSMQKENCAGDSAKNENLQVKHVSSRYCGPSLAQLNESGGLDPAINLRQRSSQTGLIVCATLIDKAPNLGGLCRTCEVLGVDEYIVRSMKLVENHEFRSVSVSAEKWMTIREVTEINLKPYLLSMRSLGYTVVALEQTAESLPVNEFEFPEKTLLVLGHEKEGIPGPLLNMVDVNVIIPQYGIVRSLNVHVAASVGIWEYVRARQGRQS